MQLHNFFLHQQTFKHCEYWKNFGKHFFVIPNYSKHASFTKIFAIFLRTSGAICGTRCEYSPSNHKMEARACGTLMLSANRAMCLMISVWAFGCVCNSFLMTTTLSATTASRKEHWKNMVITIFSQFKKKNFYHTITIRQHGDQTTQATFSYLFQIGSTPKQIHQSLSETNKKKMKMKILLL